MRMKKMKKILAIGLSVACLATSLWSGIFSGDSKKAHANVEGTNPSNLEQYKDVDYSFLNTFAYGDNSGKAIYLEYNTAQDLSTSTDIRLKSGKYVQTKGYYESGDMGGATYVISDKKDGYGCLELSNGLFANIVADLYVDDNGIRWAVFNARQFGAKGDGENPDNDSLNELFDMASKFASSAEFDRGIAYLPKGEYRAANQVFANGSNINVIGEGEESVIFTDNNFRKGMDYYEHFFMSWNGKNNYFGNFKVEAREVNWTKYMRQMSLFYCENVYIYNVDFNVPQEAWTGDRREDKQYTNLTIYTGDKNVVVDNCTMYQMSGTYRGANIGIMDFWSGGTENITIKNCELHDNARDEQIGIFSTTGKETSTVKNVDFINNNVYTYTTPYKNIHGHRTMCFTIAYNNQQVDDIYLAGNHFISDADSKFMTFGDVTNCLIEKNIFEIRSSDGNKGYVFDSSNPSDENIVIQDNEFYFTYKNDPSEGKCFSAGHLTFRNNRVFSDCSMYKFVDRQGRFEGNTLSFLVPFTSLGSAPYFSNNTVYAYGGHSGQHNEIMFILLESMEENVYTNNVINDYSYFHGSKAVQRCFDRLSTVRATLDRFDYSGNTYNCPNYSYTGEGEYLFASWYRDANIKEFICENNDFQGTKGLYGYSGGYDETSNKFREFTSNPEIPRITTIKMLNNNEETKEIFTLDGSVKLDAKVYVDTELVTDREIVWISSVEGIATVDNTGLVTKVKDGTVNVYAVSTDGSRVYGKVTIHFEKSKITDIELQSDTVTLEPNKNYKVMHEVVPQQAGLTKLKWTSEDESIATVSNDGTITSVKAGRTYINVSTLDGSNITKKIEVNVTPLTVKNIYLRHTYYYLKKGETLQMQVVAYTPYEATNQGIGKWTSSNEEVAVVDQNGLVTAVGVGEASIRAYSMDLKTYTSCHVFIEPDVATTVTATSDKTSVKLSWDEIKNAHGYMVYRWNNSTSQWDKIARVNAGELGYKDSNLTADTEYKYYVTSFVSRWDSYSQEHISESPQSNICTVKTDDQLYVGTILPLISEASIPVGYSTYIQSKVYPNGAVGGNLKYKIADETIAEVESTSGSTTVKVKGLKPGETQLIITDEYEKCVATAYVGVTPTYRVEEVEGSAKYKSATINWKAIPEEDDIAGYVVIRTASYAFSPVAYISKDELQTATFSDGTTCYTYTDGSVNYDRSYRYRVVPYVEYNTRKYTCVESKDVGIKISPYVAVEKVNAEYAYAVELNESIEIQATASNEDALKKEFVWYLNDNSDIIKFEEKTVDTAKVTGLTTGITSVDIVANDDDAAYTTSKIVVLPAQVTNVTKTVTDKSISLAWDKVTGATGYNVYKYDAQSDSWNLLMAVTDGAFTDTAIDANTSYLYRISSYIMSDGIKFESSNVVEIDAKTGEVVSKEQETTEIETPTEEETTEEETTEVVTQKPTETSKVEIPTEEETTEEETTEVVIQKPTETSKAEITTEEETTTEKIDEENINPEVPMGNGTTSNDKVSTNDKAQVGFLFTVFMVCGLVVVAIRRGRRAYRF